MTSTPATEMHTFADTIAKATLMPFVVRAFADMPDNTGESFAAIVECPMLEPPSAESIVPAGGFIRFCNVFPATWFDQMTELQRQHHASDYGMFLRWRKTKAGLVEIDPVAIDESVARWVRGIHYFAGD